MKNFKQIKLNTLFLKSIVYRIISMTVFILIFGHKIALLAGGVAFIIYYIYDYTFNKLFKIVTYNGFVLWFTGIPCSGKTTLADAVSIKLKKYGVKLERLDGDIVRKGLLSNDLGFNKDDRDKNINRITFVSKLLSRNGVAVLASFVSPYRETRKKIEESVTNFIEVYVRCSARECARRDVKGMWKKAKQGKIKKFTGFDAPYEHPLNPEIYINTEQSTLEESTKTVLNYLKKNKLI